MGLALQVYCIWIEHIGEKSTTYHYQRWSLEVKILPNVMKQAEYTVYFGILYIV